MLFKIAATGTLCLASLLVLESIVLMLATGNVINHVSFPIINNLDFLLLLIKNNIGGGLRELIAHCRTPIAEQGVVNSIEKLISRFRKETDIHILLQNEWGTARLPANMEMHIYRIVQECLTNIRKHSQANNVRVLLQADIHGDYRILVENDGKGFEQPNKSNEKGEHIGLTIMKERAKHLGGDLDLESDPEEGTRIEVNFHYNDEPEIKLGATA